MGLDARPSWKGERDVKGRMTWKMNREKRGGREMNIESTIFEIILHGGNARALAYDALKAAEEGEFQQAQEYLKEAEESVGLAHNIQTELIQKEARGEAIPFSLLIVHAQDHLMTAVAEKDLITGMIKLYERLAKLEKRAGLGE